jgi:hypothetical protein
MNEVRSDAEPPAICASPKPVPRVRHRTWARRAIPGCTRSRAAISTGGKECFVAAALLYGNEVQVDRRRSAGGKGQFHLTTHASLRSDHDAPESAITMARTG